MRGKRGRGVGNDGSVRTRVAAARRQAARKNSQRSCACSGDSLRSRFLGNRARRRTLQPGSTPESNCPRTAAVFPAPAHVPAAVTLHHLAAATFKDLSVNVPSEQPPLHCYGRQVCIMRQLDPEKSSVAISYPLVGHRMLARGPCQLTRSFVDGACKYKLLKHVLNASKRRSFWDTFALPDAKLLV